MGVRGLNIHTQNKKFLAPRATIVDAANIFSLDERFTTRRAVSVVFVTVVNKESDSTYHDSNEPKRPTYQGDRKSVV